MRATQRQLTYKTIRTLQCSRLPLQAALVRVLFRVLGRGLSEGARALRAKLPRRLIGYEALARLFFPRRDLFCGGDPDRVPRPRREHRERLDFKRC